MTEMTLPSDTKLHILTADARQYRECHLLHKLAANWAQQGAQISTGPLNEIPEDLSAVICHWDNTKVDPALFPENPHNIPLLNDRILDISKRSFSSFILTRDDVWEGPVIVKTNFNCFGQAEQKKKRRTCIQRLQRRLSKRNWKMARCLPPYNYPVLDDKSEVPSWVWANPNLVVEKFLPEQEGELYCIRFWVFFGEQSYSYRLCSNEPVVKNREDAVRFEFLEAAPPEELVRFREARGLDFGKIDYVEHEGKVVAFDINKTPTVASDADAPHLQKLAVGIVDFLK
ncbi:MAG: hypothetical protein ACSHX8_13030 [Opitutaceae bacterium]